MARKRAKLRGRLNLLFRSPDRESWSSTLPHFFRLYEKSTKKVHEGLASPLDTRRRRQIFKIWRRYWKFHSMRKRKKAQFLLTPYHLRANTSVIFGKLLVFVIIGFGLPFEFGLLNLCHWNKSQNLSFKKKKGAKYRTNEMSGILGGKTLFFPRFF